MAPLPSSRPASWVPATALLGAATLAGVAVAWSLGARAWWAYLGLVLAALLGIGFVERLWLQRKAPRPPRGRGLKVIPGGKAGLDLENDDPEHRQRWLM
jgi:O-antigen/teichoic acid export membrane protein